MLQPTGSVYLDTPTRASRRPTTPTGTPRTLIAGLLTALGVAGLSMALTIAGLRSILLEPAPVVEAFDDALDDPDARDQLEAEIARAIGEGLVGEELTEVAALYGMDVAAEAEAVAGPVLDDPAFRGVLLDLVTDLHARALLDPADDDIDLAPLSLAALAVIEREDPDFAAIIPEGAVLWTIDGETVPDLTAPIDLIDRGRLGTLVAALAIPLAFVIHPRRHRVASWIGRWALVTGLLAGLAAAGLPYLAGAVTGWTAVEVGVRSVSVRLIAPAATAGMIGMGLVSLAALAARRENQKVSEEGQAAALGMDEPAAWQQSTRPTLDLAARGLVDVDHPLTNI